MCQQVIFWGTEGKSFTAIANRLGITRDTLYRWQKKHPEFSDALTIARQAAQEWWEETLQGQAQGLYDKGANPTAAIFAMKNQFPDEYRDRREVDVSLQTVHLDFAGFLDQPDPAAEAIDAEFEEITEEGDDDDDRWD